jgi:hypothetical protein
MPQTDAIKFIFRTILAYRFQFYIKEQNVSNRVKEITVLRWE